jgi:hypothetical protein
MRKLDKAKEKIGIFKFYLGLVTAVLLSIGASVISLYNEGSINVLFWLGSIAMIVLSLFFFYTAKLIHKKIDDLEDL